MKKTLFILFVLLILTGLFFLIKKATPKKIISNKLQVTASFYPMYFFATQVGGDKVDVYNITPASAEPHDYEPTTQDVVRITQSKLLVLNGGKLEAWGNKIKDQLQGSAVITITAGDGLADKALNEEGKIIQDPHIWLSPVLAKKQVEAIEKGYEKVDPKNASYFQSNAQKLMAQLDQLDTDFRQGLANCLKKDFVTAHAAFGYLAAHYGINQIAISGVSPDEEPSSQKLAEVADLVKKKNIKVIFFESLVSPKLSQTIAQETDAKVMVLDPIEGLTQEDLNAGKNYLTVMRDNLAHLQEALSCNNKH